MNVVMQANPELVSQAMDMFSKMDPDTLAAMTHSMGAMGGAAPGAAGAPGAGMPQGAAAMQQMLNDPQVRGQQDSPAQRHQ
jgi:hypothetical protein